MTPDRHPRHAQTDGHAHSEGSIVRSVPYLAVLVLAAAGVYFAWRQGPTGGGAGGVVGGVALLAAAVVRLLAPANAVGLLAIRRRAVDVLTFTAFGAALLVMGLVLPR